MTAGDEPRPKLLLPLTVLFLLSGISGLVYQVVWFRMLLRTFGVTVYAVTTVVAVFMTGLAVGSLLAGRLTRGRKLPLLRLYAGAEILIAVIGALSTKLMVLLPHLFRDIVISLDLGSGAITTIRIILSALVLLPPTLLMGATLPLLSGHLATRPSGVGRHAGLLYGMNTLGAVVGVLTTGFVLIAILGEVNTILTAVVLNFSVGIFSFGLDRFERASAPSEAPQPEPVAETETAERGNVVRRVLIVAMVSGFCALAFEVIWARILGVLLGNSVYGFASMLGAYLIGLGVGSTIMSRYVSRVRSPIRLFALFELANSILGLISLLIFIQLGLRDSNPQYVYALLWDLGDFARLGVYAALVVLPVTLVYGAIFPVASRLVATNESQTEESIGKLYGINTIGGILGSVITGFVLIPAMGTLLSFLTMSVASFLIGIYLLRLSGRVEGFVNFRRVGLVSGLVLAAVLSVSFKDPFLTVLMSRVASPTRKLLAHEEDRGVTLTIVHDEKDGMRSLLINGLYVSNTGPGLGEMMLNLPLSFHPGSESKKVLIVGLGVGEALKYGIDVGHEISIAEIHPMIVELFSRLNPDGDRYLNDPKAKIVINDGRNHLLHSEEKYDLILVDGSPPVYASGMVNLYSLEFAQIAKQRLTEKGLFVIWFPVTCFERDLWMIMRNFSDTFPSIQLFSHPGGSNALILGSLADKPFDLSTEELTKRLSRWANPSLSAGWYAGGFRFGSEQLRKRAADYPQVTDDRPYTEYPLQPFLRGEPYYHDNRFLYR